MMVDVKRALLFVVVVVLSAPACSSTPPAVDPCTFALGASGASDATVTGTGACATTIRLALRVATGSIDAPVWSPVANAPVKVEGAWKSDGGVLVRDVVLRNPSATESVTVVGLEWSTDGAGLGLPVDRMLHEGYQSWTYTGVEAIPEPLVDVLGTAPRGGDSEDVLGEVPGVSWWYSAASGASGDGIFVGADGGTVLKTRVAIDRSGGVRMRIVQGMTGEAITLAPSESRSLDGIVLALGDVKANLEAYAKRVAARHPPLAPRKPALGGWGSWNMYYAAIKAQDLRDEAAFAKSTLAPLGLTDFLLDDGYEAHWGSWLASPEFGADLATLTAEQTTAGLRPAIWLAPIYVDVVDPMVAQHPEWFVHSRSGPLRLYNNIGPDYAALDVTNDEARAFVVQAVQQLRTWGYRTLKTDFLFGAAVEGVRQKPITGLESYALWMKTLREAVPDVHIVGCGAPTLPSVGYVDSMRIGPDVAFATSKEPQFPFIVTQARHVAFRAHTDAWWSLDPDVVLLRGTSINDADAWTVVVLSAMAGGNYLLGDPRQAGDARRAMSLAPDVLALTRDGIAARPVDLMTGIDPQSAPSPLFLGNHDTNVPHVWKKVSADGKHGAVAVFGWADDPYTTELDLPGDAYEITPPTRRPAGGHSTVTVARHGARLFAY